MACVSLTTMQVMWKGEVAGSFTPSRGFRQGDPLSPYIFVLCIERLGQLIEREVYEGSWLPIKLCKGGPALSHLFFCR